MEEIGEAAIGNVISDEKLLIFPVVESDQRKEIRVRQPSDLLHMIVKLFPPDITHKPKPLHNHRTPARQSRLVRRSEPPASENLRRRTEHILERELLLIVPNEMQLPLISSSSSLVIFLSRQTSLG